MGVRISRARRKIAKLVLCVGRNEVAIEREKWQKKANVHRSNLAGPFLVNSGRDFLHRNESLKKARRENYREDRRATLKELLAWKKREKKGLKKAETKIVQKQQTKANVNFL